MWQGVTIYYGGELAKDISERIAQQGEQRGFKMTVSDMEMVKKTDFTLSHTAIFVLQVIVGAAMFFISDDSMSNNSPRIRSELKQCSRAC
jgi:hypothetical protein